MISWNKVKQLLEIRIIVKVVYLNKSHEIINKVIVRKGALTLIKAEYANKILLMLNQLQITFYSNKTTNY